MKVTYSNFQMVGTTGKILDRIDHAEVDVITKRWFRKPETLRVRIFRPYATVYWVFTDTGDFTPGNEVEKLAHAYTAEQALKAAV